MEYKMKKILSIPFVFLFVMIVQTGWAESKNGIPNISGHWTAKITLLHLRNLNVNNWDLSKSIKHVDMEIYITQSNRFFILSYSFEFKDKKAQSHIPGKGFKNKGTGKYIGMISSSDATNEVTPMAPTTNP